MRRAMAKEETPIKMAELVEDQPAVRETPRFRDAVLGIRSVADLKDVVTNPDYNPHVHIILLLSLTYIVGIVSLALGA